MVVILIAIDPATQIPKFNTGAWKPLNFSPPDDILDL
jgi:hypothetical protein